ncbi:tannase and feruloyl esterase [Paraphaeosphaeria sporulosa]|uniref:Carboxylic ester hydrolase n=1 Tax=Paraphaeosphaeria sporulosa TaxID=1460663 RepID=A0A177CKJ3_9PLEO|nr:tannase and feruloyl esterase [Paraphaeosphaeria sporulosa]OAG07360.1 tannase and feruloyl esterase [Paraphaeosphaeria sporulosa]
MARLCRLATFLLVQAAVAVAAPAHISSHCAKLRSLSLEQFNASIVNATYHAANAFNVSETFNDIPFCEVQAQVPYGKNNSLSFVVWLPDECDYQQRFLAVGNGGFAGTIDTVSMLKQLNAGLGLVVAGGNGGHEATGNTGDGFLPFMHDPGQIRAWIHDGISLFTSAAKEVVLAYYGKAAKKSYYAGCSTGGAQGYALAQYHPHLFDGIYAGSPGFWYSHLMLSFLWNLQKTNVGGTSLRKPQLNFTAQAVLDTCDTLDGVQDGLIENPLLCNFDIDSLVCGGSSEPDRCLSPDQIEAAKGIYAGPRRADNGEILYPGFSFGSEREWLLQEGSLGNEYAVPVLRNMVFDDLNWDPSTFDWSTDVDLVGSRASVLIDEISANLTSYRRTGGKFLTSQGWSDSYNAGELPVSHLEDIQALLGGDISDFYRLFMIPGGGHCGAAQYSPEVPAEYHYLGPLIEWVEAGTPPAQLLSSDPPDKSNRTRKLCPWPQTAHLVGENVNDWKNYRCE